MSAPVRGKNQNSGGWTRREDDVLFALYEQHGARPVADKTGRTMKACNSRAAFYGLSASRSGAALAIYARKRATGGSCAGDIAAIL